MLRKIKTKILEYTKYYPAIKTIVDPRRAALSTAVVESQQLFVRSWAWKNIYTLFWQYPVLAHVPV